MARPLKDSVDYFPLDCHMSDNVKLLQAEFGITGFGVLIKLWQKIYGNKGYYCEWNKEVALLFAQEVGLGGNVVSEIIRACTRRGIFSEKMLNEHGILTSEGIQERYLAITNRRKETSILEQYALVSCTINEVNVGNNAVNVCNNSVNARNNPQSKVNKSKVNKSKESKPSPAHAKKAYGEFSNVYLTDEEYAALKEKTPDAEARIEEFSAKLKAKGYQYEDHYAAILLWIAQDKEKSKQGKQEVASSFDPDEVLKARLSQTYHDFNELT